LANYQARYNIAPRQERIIVTTKYENREVARAKWGLISRVANDSRETCSINAKAETVESRPTFAPSFTHRRCVIPVAFTNGPDLSIQGNHIGFIGATATFSCLLAFM
jgi:putative SOS response-associated peptidase YedK